MPDLNSRLRQFLRLSLPLAAFLIFCFSTWSVTWAGLSRLLSVYSSATSLLAPADQSLRWNPIDPEAHHSRALVLADRGDDVEALREMECAVRLRPLDYYLWLELGHALEKIEDIKGAGVAFREAVKLAPDYAQPHWQLGNYLLRTGDVDMAFVEMRRAAASDETLIPVINDLAWGAYEGDHRAVLQALQPPTDKARLALARFFAVHQEPVAAHNLFRSISSQVAPEERRALVSELLVAGNYPEAQAIWRAGVNRNADDQSILFDGDFEREIVADEVGFGWRLYSGAQTIHVALDSREPRSGAHSLRLEYRGNFDPATPIISQLVPVKPHTRYRLTFAARTQDLVTAGLPRVIIKNAYNEMEILSQSNTLTRGSSKWQEESVIFVTAEASGAVLICIQRQTCDVAPCPIFGQAWFDSFILEEL